MSIQKSDYSAVRKYRLLSVISLVSLLMLFVSSCREAEQENPQSRFELTDDPAIYLNTDTGALSSQITVSNSALEIDSTPLSSPPLSNRSDIKRSTSRKGTPVNDVALSLIGETKASQLSGLTLQATDVAIKANKAYVSFNQAGDVFAGSIQVIDIKNKNAPKIKAEVLFSNIDINALYLRNNVLYAAGAADTTERDISTPAVLIALPLKGGIPGKSVEVIDIPSYAATDVLVKGNLVLLTVGADGGGLVRIAKNNLTGFNESFDFHPIDDARSLAVEKDTVGVLKGTDGQIHYFSVSDVKNLSQLSTITPSRQIDLPGTATIPNSKSTIDLVTKTTIVALGDGGTRAFITDGTDDTPIINIAAMNGTDDLPPEKTVTNAVTVDKDLLFRANGEAGVDLFRLSQTIKSVDPGEDPAPSRIGSINFERLASANGLYYRKGFLFVADGLGGMKIVGVDRYYSRSDDEDEDEDEIDQDDEDNDDDDNDEDD